jgi:hypothetical protein
MVVAGIVRLRTLTRVELLQIDRNGMVDDLGFVFAQVVFAVCGEHVVPAAAGVRRVSFNNYEFVDDGGEHREP